METVFKGYRLLVTFASWSLFFFGFMAATVRQSLKGLRVEILPTSEKAGLDKKGAVGVHPDSTFVILSCTPSSFPGPDRQC